MLGQLTEKSTIQGNSRWSAKRPFGLAVIALVSLGGACGSESSTAPAETEAAEEVSQVTSSLPADDPALIDTDEQVELVESVVEDGMLRVDFSGVDEARSMMSQIFDSNGERVGFFVTTYEDGVGKLIQPEPGEEFLVNLNPPRGVLGPLMVVGVERAGWRWC
jgi:hypothetical protein